MKNKHQHKPGQDCPDCKKAAKPGDERSDLTNRNIPNKESILSFMHCRECIEEKPANISPRDWARLNVGWTQLGLQVWCVRHNKNVIHIDFGGQKHSANTIASV